MSELYSKGFSHSAINTARSAISSVLFIREAKGIGTDKLICRIVKGAFELRTPMSHHKDVWDVNILLNHFQKMPENTKLDLKSLTKKLCALMMLITAQRVQTLHTFKLSSMKIDSAGCTIKIVDKLKHTRQGKHQDDLQLFKFPNEKLCVMNCLHEYIARTKYLRRGEDLLFLCYGKTHTPASKDTLARWLKDILQDAGITDFTAHSFRSASSSAMAEAGVSVQDIMKTAGWTNASTFHKFYYKPVIQKNKNTCRNKTNTLFEYFGNKKM